MQHFYTFIPKAKKQVPVIEILLNLCFKDSTLDEYMTYPTIVSLSKFAFEVYYIRSHMIISKSGKLALMDVI